MKAYGRPLFGPEEGLPAPKVSSNEIPAPADLPRADLRGGQPHGRFHLKHALAWERSSTLVHETLFLSVFAGNGRELGRDSSDGCGTEAPAYPVW